MIGEVIATVKSISGKAYARNAEGELRELKAGSTLHDGETVVTPDGGTVELALFDGSPLTVTDAELAITRDLVAEVAPGADESAVEDETVQQVLAALESGEDLGEVLPATAAGPEGDSGLDGLDGEGHSWVRLARIDEFVSEFTGITGSEAAITDVVVDDDFIPVDAIDDAATTQIDTPVIIDVLPNDQFQLGATVIGVTDGANGTVTINDDNTVTYTPTTPGFYGTDTFTYTALSADGNGQDTANVTVVIPAPPPVEEPPTISINNDVVMEGDTATLTITLSKPWDEPVTVQYRTEDDTAVAPGDYDPVTGLVTVTFEPGETSKEITFSTNTDDLEEGTEQFLALLSNPTNATISDDTGVVEILDVYTPPPEPPEPPPPPPPPPRPPGEINVEGTEDTRNEIFLPMGRTPEPASLKSEPKPLTFTVEDGLDEIVLTPFVDGVAGAPVVVATNGDLVANVEVIVGPIRLTFLSLEDLGNGDYTLTTQAELIDTFDHDQPGIDQIELKVEMVVSDRQGDNNGENPAEFKLTVIDDIPEANDDFSSETPVDVPEDAVAFEIDALANDEFGADGPNADPNVAAAVTTQATNGNAIYNGVTGKFEYTPNAGYEGADQFSYTITDSEGDTSTATVFLNVDADSTPAVSVTFVEGQDYVDEEALSDGSNPTSDEESTSGSFPITHSGSDTTAKFEIEDKDGIKQDVTTGGTVVGVYGTLEVFESGGNYTWTYTLSDNTTDHPTNPGSGTAEGIQDDFALFVTDSDGDVSPPASLTIDVLDDGPSAVNDGSVGSPIGVAEDAVSHEIDALANDTFGADNPLSNVAVTTGASNGTAIYNGVSGKFEYTPNSGFEGADQFSYTITDADGDTSTATVFLNVDADSTPAVSVVFVEGQDYVDEAALSDGSNPTSDEESTSGSFPITHSGSDTTAKFEIEDKDGIKQDVTTGGTVVGVYGTLEVFESGGNYTWTYTLSDNTTDHPTNPGSGTAEGIQDDFALFVTDSDGDVSPPASLTIDVLDDGPSAVNDGSVGSPIGVAEDAVSHEIDALANDTFGADNPLSNVAVTTGASNGTAIYNGVSGKFEYTPNSGFEGADQFSYTITDADGDTSTATVFLNVDADSTPAVSVVFVEGQDYVDEAALSDGSNPSSDEESTSGSFPITHSGSDTTAKFEIEDKDGIKQDVTTGGTVVGVYGTLEVFESGGNYTWTYTLSDNTTDHPTNPGSGTAEGIQDDFALFVTDSDGDVSPPASLTIDVLDDGPSAVNDGSVGSPIGVAEDAVSHEIDALANDTFGADNPLSNVAVTTGASNGTAIYNGVSGKFEYTPNSGFEGADQFSYTITDADGDTSTATVFLNVDADSTPAVSVVFVEGQDYVDEAALSDGSNPTSDEESTSGSFPITHSGSDTTAKFEIEDKDGIKQDVTTGGTVVGVYGTLEVFESGGNYTWTYTLSDNTTDHPTNPGSGTAEGIQDDFALFVTDSDGDVSPPASLTIDVLDDGPSAVNDGSVGSPIGVAEDAVSHEIDALANDTFGADNPLSNVAVTTGASNGTAIYNGVSGKFEYTPNSGFEGADQFSYTITDADGDTSTATVFLNVDADSTPAVSVVFVEGQDYVDEAALSDGSNPSSDEESTSGSFPITHSGSDTTAKFEIEDKDGIKQDVTTGGTVVGVYGTLEVFESGGNYTWTYTLSDNTTDHPTNPGSGTAEGIQDDFALFVTDSDGDVSPPASLTIDVLDDGPSAVNDGSVGSPIGVAEDAVSHEIDALANDTFGADNPLSNVAVTTGASNGTAIYNGVSGKFEYTPNSGFEGADQFSYTITDADGDTSTATVFLNVDADSTPAVSVVFVEGQDYVDEAALSDGSNPTSDEESTSGSFPITHSGSDTTAKFEIEDKDGIKQDVTTGGTVVGVYGTLEVFESGGNYTWTYTLSDNTTDHPTNPGSGTAEGIQDDFALFVTDSDGDVSPPASLTIDVLDDGPAVGDFIDFSVANAIGVTAGTTNTGFISGADHWSEINVSGSAIPGLTYLPLTVNTDGSGNVTSVVLTAEETVGGDDVFTYTVFADGQHSFNLLKPEASTTVQVNLANLKAGGPIDLRELTDGTVEFEGTGVNVSTPGIGLGNNHIDPGQVLTIQFFKPGTGTDANDNITVANQRLVGAVSFTENHNGGSYDWTVYNSVEGTSESGSITMGKNDAFTIDPHIDFDTIVMEGVAGSMRPNNMSFTEKLLPDGETVTFDVTGIDGDGDPTSTDQIAVTILPGEAPDPLPSSFRASAAQDAPEVVEEELTEEGVTDSALLEATAGVDTLIGTDGEDVFTWSLADNTLEGDVVIGFDSADVVDIADLLDSSVDTADLSSYLEIGLAGDGASTVIKVSNTGDFDNAEQTITLEGVNLLDGVDLDDSAALTATLQSLVDAGKLVTD